MAAPFRFAAGLASPASAGARSSAPWGPGARTLRLSLAAAALAAVPAFAAFEDIGVGARPNAMGNAFVAIADDVHSIYYNPAGLGSLLGPEFTSSYSRLFLGLSDGSSVGQSFLAYAQPVKRGDWGTLGIGGTVLELSGLYRERSIYLSYGKVVRRELGPGSLLFGFSLKQLTRSVSVPTNPNGSTLAEFPVNNVGAQPGGAQDTLLREPTKTVMDLDVGFLYPFKRRYAVGLQVLHVMGPDVAVGGGEKLALGQKLGFAYRGPLTKLTLEVQRLEGSNGVTDQTFVLGGERWFRTERSGEFAVRTGFGVGAQSFTQFSMGAGYRFNKLQLDYGFTLPFGGITHTSGHQRFALSFRFGRGETEEETAGERALRELRGLGGLEPTTYEEKIALTKERQEATRQYGKAQASVQEGLFAKASNSMGEAIRKDPSIPGISEYYRRLSFVSEIAPEMTDLQTKSRSYVFNGILDFLGSKDNDAVRKVAYGYSLNKSDKQVGDLLDGMEKFTGIKAERMEGETPMSLADRKLVESLIAFKKAEYDRVVALCQQVLELEPENLTALNRLGSALYALRDYDKAVTVWQKAYELETNPNTKAGLKKYIDRAQERLKSEAGRKDKPAEAAPAPTQPAPTTP